MPRLAAAVLGLGEAPSIETDPADDSPAGAHYRLRFDRDRRGRSIVSGCVQTGLRVCCQRCLGELEIPVDAAIALALVRRDEDARDLPDHLDPWLIADDRVRPLELVEDELLLAIPQIPRHSAGCCHTNEVCPCEASIVEGKSAESSEGYRPFAILGTLRSSSGA
ncbi:MAG: YceD family protein [Thiocapsa sp.]|jgi:uncharacterized protein|nr:YceD family protein [Thiocapsa sp.]MCG6897378.1 YceD family protein [Thiocapsa sp.]MCG6984467.1 YceD family protein [Thiocapsa sp.]